MPNEQQLVSSRLGRSTPVTMVSIIDDDECAREAMGDLVQSLGYEVATFDNMPGLNGLELQSRLNADGDSTHVIFVTAFPEERFRERAMSAGAVGFLSKPFDENSLIHCLETALTISPAEDES